MKKLFASTFLLATCGVAVALPFSITVKSGTQLPTTIYQSGIATAYYTVTNKTHSQRNNNYIKYLPPNVVQVTEGGTYSDTCGSQFNLAANGNSGDSCTLQLSVMGVVSAFDPNPHHHLFACFPGGISCAGTEQPLNVAVATTARYAYVTQEESSATPVLLCQINSTNGTLENCVDPGNDAALANIYAEGITVNSTGTVAYITSGQESPNSYAYQCNINKSDGTFSSCSQSVISSPSSPPYNPYYGFAALGASDSNIFLASDAYDSNQSTIFACPISNGVISSTCSYALTSVPGTYPVGIAFNRDYSSAYIGIYDAGVVYQCAASGTTFSSCSSHTGAGAVTFGAPSGVAFNPDYTSLYITDYSNNQVYNCAPDFSTCSVAQTVSSAWGIAIGNVSVNNTTQTYAYITDYGSIVYACPVLANGSLGTCVPSSYGFSYPVDVALLY